MIVFVIPLRSQQSSNSWDRVLKLFERCIKSICNQTSPDFRVIVVCHKNPHIEFNHPHITYIEVDLPPPAPALKTAALERWKDPDLTFKRLDKLRKVLTGFIYAQQLKPSYIMIVDADDCVSKHLAEFVSEHHQSNGWFVNKGYVYLEGSQLIYYKKYAFNRSCGTCRIVRYDLYDLPAKVEDAELTFLIYIASHKSIEIKKGVRLKQLPFEGAIYVIGNGENLYQTGFDTLFGAKAGITLSLRSRIREAFNYRFITKSIRSEFGLYKLN
jgi:hypothetical protein